MENPAHSTTEIYQFRIYLQGISPMIWRSLWLRSAQVNVCFMTITFTSLGCMTFGWKNNYLFQIPKYEEMTCTSIPCVCPEQGKPRRRNAAAAGITGAYGKIIVCAMSRSE